MDGASVVQASCFACHGSGVMNAPKIGAADDWKPRLQATGGIEGLTKSAIAGKGAMPPKGGNAALSDAAIAEAVKHMLGESGL